MKNFSNFPRDYSSNASIGQIVLYYPRINNKLLFETLGDNISRQKIAINNNNNMKIPITEMYNFYCS